MKEKETVEDSERSAIPSTILRLLYEYSGSPNGNYKGYILFACNEEGGVHWYRTGNGVVQDGLVQNVRNFISRYDAKQIPADSDDFFDDGESDD